MAIRFSLLVTTGLAVSTLVVLSAAQATQSPPQQTAPVGVPVQSVPETTFNVDVSVLTMSVTVTDEKTGKSVNGLTKDDFVLLEDGKQRPITGFRAVTETTENRVPLGLGIVLDVSRSLSQARKDAIRVAVEALVNKRLNSPEDQLYLMEFWSAPRLVVPWTNDRKHVLDEIRRLKTKDGTSIYDAIAEALPISSQGKNKKEVILVVTDGLDTSSKLKKEQVADMARRAEVLVYGIIAVDEETVGSQPDTSEARQAVANLALITDATGGRTQFVRGFQELENVLGTFGKDLVSQYEVSFERSAPKDGQFHPVRVGVRRQGIVVRHKLGYVSN
jgi:VWFA-related protein